MAQKIFFIFALLLVFYFSNPKISFAQQPTFGPVCEVGVTCVPTNRPTATIAPRPTAVPTLLRTGSIETTLALLGMGALFIFLGTVALTSFIFLKV